MTRFPNPGKIIGNLPGWNLGRMPCISMIC